MDRSLEFVMVRALEFVMVKGIGVWDILEHWNW